MLATNDDNGGTSNKQKPLFSSISYAHVIFHLHSSNKFNYRCWRMARPSLFNHLLENIVFAVSTKSHGNNSKRKTGMLILWTAYIYQKEIIAWIIELLSSHVKTRKSFAWKSSRVLLPYFTSHITLIIAHIIWPACLLCALTTQTHTQAMYIK